MDFSKAIEAHISWKRRLADFISGKSQELDLHTVSNDHDCEIGKWIQTDGMKYETIPEFKDLKTNHAKFHSCVADVIKLKMQGNTEKALKTLNDIDSEYKLYTSKTINSIMALQNFLNKSEK